MSFNDFYQRWLDREIRISFKHPKDMIRYYLNWIFVALSFALSISFYHLSSIRAIDNLVADVLIAVTMCIFLYFVLFGTKIMKGRRQRLYETERILIKERIR